MKKILTYLIKDIEVLETKGNLDIEITGLNNDSRAIKKGDIYFAINGFTEKGSKFIPSAIENGAVAVIVENDEDLESFEGDIAYIKVNNVRKNMAHISNAFYNHPSKEMTLIGITGTKGKSTSTFMIKKILEKAGKKVCLIGGLGAFVNDEKIYSTTKTTPESFEIAYILRKAKDMKAEYAVLEVSSQSIVMDRVLGMEFDVTAFTNFTEDHISPNEHPTMEAYFEAKLEALNLGKINILNADDENVIKSKDILENETITFGIYKDADFKAEGDISLKETGAKFILNNNGKKEEIEIAIPGIFSVYNALRINSSYKWRIKCRYRAC